LTFPKQLPDLGSEFQFEQGCEDFRGGHVGFEQFQGLIDVRGFISFQETRIFRSWGESGFVGK